MTGGGGEAGDDLRAWLADPAFREAWAAFRDAIAADAVLIAQGARPTHQAAAKAAKRVMAIVGGQET